jgi:hypothetical protein
MIYLPIEIRNKILLYNIHPVAELFKKVNPVSRIIKTVIKLYTKLNIYYLEEFPEDEFCTFSEFYMYFSN